MEATQFAVINFSYDASFKLIVFLAIVAIVDALSSARSLLHNTVVAAALGTERDTRFAMYHTYP